MPYTKKCLSWFHRAGSKTMVSTKTLKKEAESCGLKNVVIRPLGVAPEIFFRKQESFATKQYNFKHPVFVFLGRLAKEKNIEEFLKCDLPVTKLVIGDGPLKKQFEKKYKDALFVGWKNEKDIADYFSACDVFVFPSTTDTFGIAIIEALSCGLPVAAHNVMGPKDIITNGVDGYLEEDLKQAAIKCLNLSKEDCRKKALKFSWDSSAESFINNLVKVK